MKFAVVHNWPGMKNAELEIIKRIGRIAAALGYSCTVISPFGHPLNSDGEHFDHTTFIDSRTYDFCLNLHYVNPNFFDTFSYAVNWNPLDYVVRNPMNGEELPAEDIAYRTACLESHDALLSAGSQEMDDFAASLNLVTGLHVESKNLYLHTSTGLAEEFDFPDFNNFKVFYIGANWERQQGESRHGRLIGRLDETGIFSFFGVSNQHGIDLWKDVKHYEGELPFDGGKSILEKSNQCGVSLALHSRAHRKSGLVSTRIFQACAAKTLTICDDNPFILENFGDSVLAFEYADDPEKNYEAIMEKVAWIKHNPRTAMEKARKAHMIFKEKFSLEKEIAHLFESHKSCLQQYADTFFAFDASTRVDVLYICRDEGPQVFETFLNDVHAQVGIQIRAVVFVRESRSEEITSKLSKTGIGYEVIEYVEAVCGNPVLDGRLVSKYLKEHAASSWFTLYSHKCRWKKTHLTQLVRAAGKDRPVAISGTFIRNKAFSELKNDYYALSMKSIGTYPRGVNVFEIGNFFAGRYTPSSMLFSTAFFKSYPLYGALPFFDKGWGFFLVAWNYLQSQRLPAFVPKLTTVFCRDDDHWYVDAYMDSLQAESLERSLAQSFLKNDPYYSSIREQFTSSGNTNSPPYYSFSVYEYFSNVLRNRPILLKIFYLFIWAGRFILGLNKREASKKR